MLAASCRAKIAVLLSASGVIAIALAIAMPWLAAAPTVVTHEVLLGELMVRLGALPRTEAPPDVALDIETLPWSGTSIEMTVRYPRRLPENESACVNVAVRAVSFEPEPVTDESRGSLAVFLRSEPVAMLLGPVTLTVFGAAFDVAPEYDATKEVGTLLPAEWSWSVSPNKAGSQILVLDVHELREAHNSLAPEGHEPVLVIEDSEGRMLTKALLSDASTIQLPVEVLTPEGIPLRVYLALRYGLGALGFVLMCPIAVVVLTRLMRRHARQEKGRW